jgi:hypothetical protein
MHPGETKSAPSDPLYLKNTAMQTLEIVVFQFENMCIHDPIWVTQFEAGNKVFLNDIVDAACKKTGLMPNEFWFAVERYLSLSVVMKRMLQDAAQRSQGCWESAGEDGHPADATNIVPQWDGRGSKPIEVFDQQIVSGMMDGYYQRGVSFLYLSLPRLAMFDLIKAAEATTNPNLKCGAYSYVAIAKWQLGDQQGALTWLQKAEQASKDTKGVDFITKLSKEMRSGTFDGDLSKLGR